jgi:26S proteasome regulatory subunit T4
VCTEAGMFAIRAGRGYTTNDDFHRGVRKLLDAKKLEQNKIDTSNFQGTKG